MGMLPPAVCCLPRQIYVLLWDPLGIENFQSAVKFPTLPLSPPVVGPLFTGSMNLYMDL